MKLTPCYSVNDIVLIQQRSTFYILFCTYRVDPNNRYRLMITDKYQNRYRLKKTDKYEQQICPLVCISKEKRSEIWKLDSLKSR